MKVETKSASLDNHKLSRRNFLELFANGTLGVAITSVLRERASNFTKPDPFTLLPDLSFPEPNPEANLYPPFKVFFPGGTGGGEYLTAIRDYLHTNYGDQVFVPSSISHKNSLKRGENLEIHYKNLGHEIEVRAKDRNIHIVAHSLGGFESIDVIKNLLRETEWNGKEIKLTFIAGLGFIGEGISGIVETADRLIQMAENVTGAEQHTAYPLPEEYYSVYPPKSPSSNKATTIFTDSPEQRVERRSWFKSQLDLLAPDTKDKILKNLDEIDKTLVKAINTNNSQLLGKTMSQREEILAPIIQLLFKGINVPKKLHEKYIDLYKETANNLASGIQYYISLLTCLSRAIDNVKDGVSNVLKEVVEAAKVRNVNIKIEFALLERDYLIQIGDIDTIKKDFDTKDIASALGVVNFFQQLAHSSLGYRSEALGKVFKN